jgi:hypothetical protein
MRSLRHACYRYVIAGLDPAIFIREHEMPGSSPRLSGTKNVGNLIPIFAPD